MKFYNYLFVIFVLAALPNEVFAVSRSWYQKAHVGGDARHRCTAFAIGNKGYYGGGHINSGTSVTYKDYWEYDPATNSWTQIADYGGGLRYHASAFTIGNSAYVGCGENGTHSYTKDWWQYIPEVNTWFPISDLPAIERRGGTAFSIDGIGYYGLGQSDLGYREDFFSYDPETDTWTEVATFPGTERSAAVSFVLNSKGYVGTGHITSFAVQDFFEYDPATDTWTEKTPVGGSVRQDAMAFAIDGKGYIGTGNDNEGNDFDDIWEYDADTDTWTQIEDFSGDKRRYATTFIIDNIPYLVGGTDGTNLKDTWAYAPTVSVEEEFLNKLEVQLYPNPSTERITISTNTLPITDHITVQISDMNGRTILQTTINQTKFEIHKSNFGAGTFLLNVYYDQSIVKTEKFIFN